MPVTNVGSRWSSGDLIFYEKNVSLGTIGNILTIGDDAVTIGSATNDIDLKVFLGSSTEYVLFDVGNSRIDLGADGKGVDMRFFGETASSVMTWTQASDALIFTGADLQLKDGDMLVFGTGAGVAGDVQVDFTDGTGLLVVGSAANENLLLGSDTYTLNTTLKGTLTVGKDGTGHDVKFFGATAGAYVLWDESGDELVFATGASIDITADKVMIDFKAGDASTIDPSATAETGWININVDGTKRYVPFYAAS